MNHTILSIFSNINNLPTRVQRVGLFYSKLLILMALASFLTQVI